MKRGQLLTQLADGSLIPNLAPVYGSDAPAAAARLLELTEEFAGTFPCGGDTRTLLFSAPGRTELGGNHTDHQHGHGLAASVDLDTIACVCPNDTSVIRIKSRHHRMAEIDLNDLAVHPEEADRSVSLLRGVAARFRQLGYALGGFDAYTTTRVLRGGGLSSSAAFEVLVATILNHLFCGDALTATEIAQTAQYAENVYFGKPCGLLDQLACATGGVLAVDFRNLDRPRIRRVQVDLASQGYAMCIVDTRASHSDLTADYAAIIQEMRAVAACLDCEVLGQADAARFRRELPRIRALCGDRAVLRAHHFFTEDARVSRQCDALEAGDLPLFLELVRQSGLSSYMYLQNVSTYRDSRCQPMALLLALAEDLLGNRGACRVHGGGFAGTIQAFVPLDLLPAFTAEMEAVAGPGTCYALRIRSSGSVPLID